MNALIVVDIQNDFLPEGALAVPNGDQVVQVANRLMTLFDLVVATQDWHPAGHKSFASSHADRAIGDVIKLGDADQILWPDHCVQNTLGAQFAEGLDTNQIHQVIQKGTNSEIDSYSGFFDNDRQHSTGLDEFLKSKNVDRCFIIGLATDYCVKFTALDSVRCGFTTTVIQSGCRAVNLQPSDEQNAYAEMRSSGVTVVENVMSSTR